MSFKFKYPWPSFKYPWPRFPISPTMSMDCSVKRSNAWRMALFSRKSKKSTNRAASGSPDFRSTPTKANGVGSQTSALIRGTADTDAGPRLKTAERPRSRGVVPVGPPLASPRLAYHRAKICRDRARLDSTRGKQHRFFLIFTSIDNLPSDGIKSSGEPKEG